MMNELVLMAAGPAVGALGKAEAGGACMSRCQSMPRWYWLLSCTSTMVASISTWRLALAHHLVEEFLDLLVLARGGADAEHAGLGVRDHRGRLAELGRRLRRLRLRAGAPGRAGGGGGGRGAGAGSGNDLVGLAQQVLDVADQRVPELVDRGRS